MSAVEPRRWVDLERDISWEHRDWLDQQAADAYHERLCEEDAREQERRAGTAECRCTICGRPASDDLCPKCDRPTLGPDSYGNER